MFSTNDINIQLERILKSPKFLVAEQLSLFLRYVVEETLADRQVQIKQYTVGVYALGRGRDFNPQTDPIVRMQARRLRRTLQHYYDNFGASDPIRIEIPKGKYIPVFIANEENSLVIPEAIPQTSNPVLSKKSSIGLFPFIYLEHQDELEYPYFADSLVEEFIIALTQSSSLRVVGLLKRDKPHAIGQKFEVRFLLDGTIRKHDQNLRVTAKLVDTQNGDHLWAQALDNNLEEATINEIESRIVNYVTSTITDIFGIITRTLVQESSEQSYNSSHYKAIKYFYQFANTLNQEAHSKTVKALRQTVAENPDDANALEFLGDLLASTYFLGYTNDLSVVDEADNLVHQALALDPSNAGVHFTKGAIHFTRLEREACLHEFDKALKLNPHGANNLAAISLYLGMVGEWEKSIQQMNKAMSLNPYHPTWYHLVPFMYHYRHGRYDAALDEALRFQLPTYFWDPLIRAATSGQLGRKNEAKNAIDELIELVPDFKKRWYSLIQRMVFSKEHTMMLANGLKMAGLELEA